MDGLWTFLIGAVLGGAAGSWAVRRGMSRRFKKPLEELERGVRLWAQGDLSASLDREKLDLRADLAEVFEKARDAHFQTLGERRREAAREKLRLEGLVRNIPDGLVLCNLRGDVVAINERGAEILGARGMDDVHTPEFRMKIQSVLTNHTHCDVVELPQAKAGGTVNGHFRTTVTLFSTPGEDDITVMLLLRDIASERRVEAAKDEFFRSVANDLRAPLFAMQGYLRLLEKAVNPEKHHKGYFDAISQSCERLALFIQDTLDSARMETGQLPLAATPVDARALLRRVADLFRAAAEEKGARLEASVGADVAPLVDLDERLMERALHNLVSNALRYTPRGGVVKIAMGSAGASQLELSVSDMGPGIPESQRVRIFDKFRETEPGQPRAGFGLGLDICRKIVRLHGGMIWVESEPGKGSQFIFRIPVRQRPQGDKHASTKDS